MGSIDQGYFFIDEMIYPDILKMEINRSKIKKSKSSEKE